MPKNGYIKWFSDIRKADVALVGGKCANLGELRSIGIPVPDGFAITTQAYIKLIQATDIDDSIDVIMENLQKDLSDTDRISEASKRIRSIVEQAKIPEEISGEIKKAYNELMGKEKFIRAAAVRSSGTQEDSADASFAGQFDTFLNVNDEEALLKTVKKCWSSLFGPRIIKYRAVKGIGYRNAGVCVAVQQMINPRTAGVMFTLDPVSGEENKIFIEGNWGLGESLVSGSVTPDRILLKKEPLEVIRVDVSVKEVSTVINPDGGIVQRKAEDKEKNKPCLNEIEAIYLGKLAKKIENHYGTPQDIEWAISKGQQFPDSIFILQTRNETVWSQKKSKKETTKSESEAVSQITSALRAGWGL